MKLIILDRDGVINQDSDAYIKSPGEWVPIPGSLEAIARLNYAGYRVVIATNQAGISHGLFDIETLNRIHEKMHRLTYEAGGAIEAIFFCPEADDNHPQRKPNPGMFEDLAVRLRIDLKGVPAIGDSLRDLQAARTVGARPILVLTGKGQLTQQKLTTDFANIEVFNDLSSTVDTLLAENN
ncbi:MAG: D-glycero-beta-D-manno-heptose 1,7-bisphosphate 7-phosphatase [Candidatus Competibacteraceae bacterium]|jgi:D-glycero-D-manno-heptose 1,7-bisphosphate phosphatase|nr:D-glycero-beta-D-manno-heptose 1,7-bisphosphate 7-phosphatase [Candidatus Competibacteraceae bacterium]